MKVFMTVQRANGSLFEEDYDSEDLPDRKAGQNIRTYPKRISIQTQEELEQWGKNLIDWYNSTLKPHEPKRKFVSICFGWILAVKNDNLGLVEQVIKDPVDLLMKRLLFSKAEAKLRMKEALKSQTGIALPETATEHSGLLMPPNSE